MFFGLLYTECMFPFKFVDFYRLFIDGIFLNSKKKEEGHLH